MTRRTGRRDPAERRADELRERPLRPWGSGPRPTGRLLIVGGHEDREGKRVILRRLAQLVGDGGKLVVATVATGSPREVWEEYESVFRALEVPHVHHLRVEARADAEHARALRVLDDATAVFFTGGDQLKITTLIGDTPVFSRIYEIFRDGGTVAGTSAGASVMSETMIVGGDGETSHRIRSGDLSLAPGLGFARDMVVDQHFAERGRIGRLLGVVAQNPRVLGVGIDENTAIELEADREFQVLGEGGVTVIDGSAVTHTNVSEEERDRSLSIFGARVHLLSQGDCFTLATRAPAMHPAAEVEEAVGAG